MYPMRTSLCIGVLGLPALPVCDMCLPFYGGEKQQRIPRIGNIYRYKYKYKYKYAYKS